MPLVGHPQGLVGPILVVIHQPVIGRSLYFRDRVEQVCIQHLDPETLIEPFDERILNGLARLDEQQSYTMPLGLIRKALRCHLRTVVQTNS